MEWIHPEQFRRCVARYGGHYKVRDFSCWDQFLAMSFAQITFRESLADIEICLRSRGDREEVFGGIGQSWKGHFVGGKYLVNAVTRGPTGERDFGNFQDYSQVPEVR